MAPGWGERWTLPLTTFDPQPAPPCTAPGAVKAPPPPPLQPEVKVGALLGSALTPAAVANIIWTAVERNGPLLMPAADEDITVQPPTTTEGLPTLRGVLDTAIQGQLPFSPEEVMRQLEVLYGGVLECTDYVKGSGDQRLLRKMGNAAADGAWKMQGALRSRTASNASAAGSSAGSWQVVSKVGIQPGQESPLSSEGSDYFSPNEEDRSGADMVVDIGAGMPTARGTKRTAGEREPGTGQEPDDDFSEEEWAAVKAAEAHHAKTTTGGDGSAQGAGGHSRQ
jgi:hypothetical protein